MESKKVQKEFDIVITMSSKEAKILRDAFGEKSGAEDEEYYKSKEIHEVISELFKALDNEA